ncbi:hypothetical protein ACFSKI_09570 [Pseudogracilibacillus auburnensis]|uniref:DUF4064 domain-containing protein n=1 Tax=Pseudogracilibacillus auburnensis TaxID=1494959 RepID=A0A2V3VN82_9BACI|nr:hypothetical protein [Pseudogracilibacillus auburnensis]PXW82321.1 hypothetical protein DFR56_1197 [Pseudogracilibacillus auburnensis]
MKKHANVASVLSLIGGIIYLIGFFLFVMGALVHILEEGIDYLDIIVRQFFLFPALIKGILGLTMFVRVKQKPTITQGVILIICGAFSLFFFIGILFTIAGIFTIIASEEKPSRVSGSEEKEENMKGVSESTNT